MPSEEPELLAPLAKPKERFGWLERAFETPELAKTPGLDDLVTRIKATVRHPGIQYIHIKDRRVKLSWHDVLMQATKTWRLVDRVGPGHRGKPRNTIARELALSFWDPQTLPLLACDQAVIFFKDLLLEWVADPIKREFLISIWTKYSHLVEKDWRRPTDEMEIDAATLMDDCRRMLFPNTNISEGDRQKPVKPDEIEKRMMGMARETNRRFPNSCKTWMIIILYWLVDHKIAE